VSSTIERLEKSRVRLEMEIDGQTVKQKFDQTFKKAVMNVAVPGFRKGKTPRDLFERMIGKESIYASAVEDLIQEALYEALRENKLIPVDKPLIDIEVDYDRLLSGDPLNFKVEVDIHPEVKLGEYKGLKATKKVRQIKDSDVDAVLANLQERWAQLEVSESDTAQNGDFLTIDFEGKIDGEVFPGGKADDYVMVLGSNQLLPEFEQNLLNAKLGEQKEFEVKFPSDYHNESLRDKTAVFTVKLKEIKQKKLPELDDAFASEASGADTLVELKGNIRENLKESVEHSATEQLENDLLEQICDASEVEIPDSMITHECQHMFELFQYNLARQGIDWESYLKYTEQTKDQLMESYRSEAEKRVKRGLVIDAICETEKMSVKEEEVDQYIQNLSLQDKDADKRYNTPQVRDRIAEQLIIKKVFGFIVENADVTEEIITDPQVEQDTSDRESDKEKKTSRRKKKE
jgi:trigger factor